MYPTKKKNPAPARLVMIRKPHRLSYRCSALASMNSGIRLAGRKPEKTKNAYKALEYRK
jgi:hypothetical protein